MCGKRQLIVLLLFTMSLVGCTDKKESEPIKNVLGLELKDKCVENAAGERDEAESLVPLGAKHNLEITPGDVIYGIFDKSRETLRLSCKSEDGEKKIYINEREQLSVSDEKIIKLYDIALEDAYLELLIVEPLAEMEQGYRINVYRILSEGVEEVYFLPLREENTFCIEEWYWLSFREGIIQAFFDNGDYGMYQLMPEGYFVKSEEPLVRINVDGKTLCLPKNNVAVYEGINLGIAFEVEYSMMSTTHYKVYRSLDGGSSWSLIEDDFSTEVSTLENIYIFDDFTIYVCFGPGGASGRRMKYISKDAGETWGRFNDDRILVYPQE